MKKRTSRLSLGSAGLLGLFGCGAAAMAGTFSHIMIDGDFSDWSSIPVAATDPAGDGNPIDYAQVQIANDDANVYLHVTYATAVNPNGTPSTYLAFDTDNTVGTGFDIYGLHVVGSDAGWQNDFPFDQRGGFNSGGINGAALISPFAVSTTDQEYAIPRNATYTNDNAPVFANNSFTLMLWTDSGTQADTTIGMHYTFASAATGWAAPGGNGDWNVAANWSSGVVPNAVGAQAQFLDGISAPSTVYTNTGVTVGSITFDNANTYVLTGAGSLTLDVSSGSASIQVVQGSQKINLPLILNKNTTADVATGATLTIADPLTLANGSTLTKTGAGTLNIISTVDNAAAAALTVSGGALNASLDLGPTMTVSANGGTTSFRATQHLAALNVGSGGHAALVNAGGSKVLVTKSLSIATGGQLDLGSNNMVVDYTGPVGSLVGDIRQHLQTGRLTSSSGDSSHVLGYGDNAVLGKTSFAGQTVDSSSVLVKFTYAGDANLDGQVDVTDLGALATSWQTSAPWTGGDFNYDGFVDVTDLGLLATNWQQGVGNPLGQGSFEAAMAAVGLGGVSVPEPWALGTTVLLGGLLWRKRR